MAQPSGISAQIIRHLGPTPPRISIVSVRAYNKNLLETAVALATVDGQNPAPVEVGSLSHYLQGFIHTRRLFGFRPSTV